jgi:pantoate--beta-alanine ligase
MITIETVRDMQAEADRIRSAGRRIGLVPTMGALHEGHLSLVREARRRADVVAVSIYVNPTQFGPQEDFARYPRDPDRDAGLAAGAGADVLFVPGDADMYPDGACTWVEVTGLTDTLCGASRPGHFRGVTTVVAKLFNAVKPHTAVFGQKDAQQAVVIRRMTRDLGWGVEIVTAPVVREPDGLALSSRNAYLSPPERRDALALSAGLAAAARLAAGGERRADAIAAEVRGRLEAAPSVRVDYVAVVHPETLAPLGRIDGPALVAVAAFVGRTRLIDNAVIG